MSFISFTRSTAVALLLTALSTAQATQFRLLDNHTPIEQYGNDDDSTDAISFGFSANLFGTTYSELFINNNGNVTFAFPSGLGNPSSVNDGLAQNGGPVLAPFFADVDTTYTGALSYGLGTIGGFNAFVVNWTNVAAYGSGLQPSLLNTFQLFMVDRSDTGAGNFDFEFNYAKIQWDEGANSTVTALAGFSDAASTHFLLPGSGVSGSFLDNGPADTSLINNILGIPFDGAVMDGRYAFSVRDGEASYSDAGNPGGGGGGTPSVPDHGPVGLGTAVLAALFILHRGRSLHPVT